LIKAGIGLHCSSADLMSLRAIAIPGAISQIAIATLLGKPWPRAGRSSPSSYGKNAS
jgi:predicted Kef-type K+ transport protein